MTIIAQHRGCKPPETHKNAECCHGDADHEPINISYEDYRITAECERCELGIFAVEIDQKLFAETAEIIVVEWERQ